MSAPANAISRRAVLYGSGAIVIGFSLSRWAAAQQPGAPPPLPGDLKVSPLIDSWIRIDGDGITVFTGKVELGQGVKTALIQVAAEELGVEPRAIKLVTADTSRTPDEGITSGSQSMSDGATAVRNAAAQARELLLAEASRRWRIAAEDLKARNGMIAASDGRSVAYAELVGDELLHVAAQPRSKLKNPASFEVMGKPLPRVDIPSKVTGAVAYVQDLRLPGMVHARVLRPPSYGARLASLDTAPVERMAGVLKVARDGSFLAVVAEKEFTAIQAQRALAMHARWEQGRPLPRPDMIYDWIAGAQSEDHVILDRSASGSPAAPDGARRIEAVFHRPYQMHGSIGSSCAVAAFANDTLTVWTHSQGIYPLRDAIAEMLNLPRDRVRCVHVEGAGCYGHNGADDVGADAALIAVAFPGRPVRVQWMREDEHMWEPFGPAMVTRVRAALDASGNVADWQYEVWSNSHATRPSGKAGNLAPAWTLEKPFEQPKPRPIPQPAGGGDRNAIPLYNFANARVVHHFIPEMPLRVSSLRSLGAYMNVFSIESTMDELARAAGVDPVEFRLRYLEDARARDVVALAAQRFGWQPGARLPAGRGRGFGFARYKNYAAYAAVAIEVAVEHESGRVRPLRVVAADDSGEIVNPDGIRNQIEGGIVQALSWSLFEAVGFDDKRITSTDWASYPIARFPDLPDSVEVHLIPRPGAPFLGTGEAGQGPTAAALANAVADATGVRLRELPLTPTRVKAAIGI